MIEKLPPEADVFEFICAAAIGDVRIWPQPSGMMFADAFLKIVFEQRMNAVVHYFANTHKHYATWPRAVTTALVSSVYESSVDDILQHQEMEKILQQLHVNGLTPILLKGLPVAYDLYPQPHLRLRSDVDLLIRESELKAFTKSIAQLGYQTNWSAVGGNSHSISFNRLNENEIGVELDVHWQLSHAPMLASRFASAELFANTISAPSIHPAARSLNHVYGLLHACCHLIGHQYAPFYRAGEVISAAGHLLWVYDIHRFAQRLTAPQWDSFAGLAEAKGLIEICQVGIDATRVRFNTAVPIKLTPQGKPPSQIRPISVKRLMRSETHWHIEELLQMGNFRNCFNYLKKGLFPQAEYMMNTYQNPGKTPLAYLYLHRLVTGIWRRKRFERQKD